MTTIEDARPDTIAWRLLMPREHGLWAWAGLPLTLMLLLAPGLGSVCAALTVLAGVGAANALSAALARRQARALTVLGIAMAVGSLLAVCAIALTVQAELMLVTLLSGGIVGLGVTSLGGGRRPRRVGAELLGIALFVAIGLGLTLAGGRSVEASLPPFFALFVWLVCGVWFVKAELASVLAHRTSWSSGALVLGVLVAASAGLGFMLEAPWVGMLPATYVVRVVVHRPVTGPGDARRLGLQELGWGFAFVFFAALLSGAPK